MPDNYERRHDVKKVWRRRIGAVYFRLFIGGNDSVLQGMGAEITDDPIAEIAESEPFDLQMVCSVG